MPRVKNPLPEMTDGEILRVAAMRYDLAAGAGAVQARRFRRGVAARLRAIARRVPLWTDNKEISR